MAPPNGTTTEWITALNWAQAKPYSMQWFNAAIATYKFNLARLAESTHERAASTIENLRDQLDLLHRQRAVIKKKSGGRQWT